MAISDDIKDRFDKLWRAQWAPLTEASGREAWLDWMDGAGTQDKPFSLALDAIICERRAQDRFHRLNDRPPLNEFQAVYYKQLKGMSGADRPGDNYDPCDYCLNMGRRWLVIHADCTTGINETAIVDLPKTLEGFRQYCYAVPIPCTCAKGRAIFDDAMKAQKIKRPMDSDKQQRALAMSFTHRNAANFVDKYLQVRNHKYFGKPLTNKEDQNLTKMRAIIAAITKPKVTA